MLGGRCVDMYRARKEGRKEGEAVKGKGPKSHFILPGSLPARPQGSIAVVARVVSIYASICNHTCIPGTSFLFKGVDRNCVWLPLFHTSFWFFGPWVPVMQHAS
jgi:hypothetical protein